MRKSAYFYANVPETTILHQTIVNVGIVELICQKYTSPVRHIRSSPRAEFEKLATEFMVDHMDSMVIGCANDNY